MCCKTLLSLSNLKTSLTSSGLQSLHKMYHPTSLNCQFNKASHRGGYCPENSAMSSSLPNMSPEPSMSRACLQMLLSVNWLTSLGPLLASNNCVSSQEKPKMVKVHFCFADFWKRRKNSYSFQHHLRLSHPQRRYNQSSVLVCCCRR